jgi:hypothetical protein
MRQIYINTRFGTTRIDYDETNTDDIIIVASAGTVIEAVVREPIECSGIAPQDIVTFVNDAYDFEPAIISDQLTTWND